MDRRRRERNVKVLWGLVLVAITYSSLLHYLRTLTGRGLLDAIVGVFLGLYICSHPAAHGVDVLFFERGHLRQVSSGWSGMRWLALNTLVMLAGWVVIVIGITRLVD